MVVHDSKRRVVIRRLHQELLGLDVVLGGMICSPQEHSEQERRRLVAPPSSPIEIIERRIKSLAVLSEDNPHPHDEERL